MASMELESITYKTKKYRRDARGPLDRSGPHVHVRAARSSQRMNANDYAAAAAAHVERVARVQAETRAKYEVRPAWDPNKCSMIPDIGFQTPSQRRCSALVVAICV